MPSSRNVIKNLKQLVETERAFGLEEIRSPRPAARAAAGAPEKGRALQELNRKYQDCRMCGLCEGRTHVVFGSGDPEARLMFVGEAPGHDEDREGLPFVGKAGQLLTKIIEAMKLKREEVYIANCLKCRPPNNRPPLPTEIAACKPILLAQIEIIRPRIVCALGKFAAQTLLGTDEPIGALRGRFFDWRGMKLMPTYHPAYLLRNPADKKVVWRDVQKIMAELNAP